MAETLASTLNKPLDPLSLVGQVSRQPDILSRGRAARQATEPLMRGEQEAATEVRRIQRTGDEEIARIAAEQAKESETRATTALSQYEAAIGNVPQRPVQQANPNELMELAALTAILGGLAGATGGGRAALAAMEGISEGYKLGQQDVYERGIKDYQAALESYKSNVQAAKTNLDNFFKMENVKKGSGAAELKQFETRLAGTVADAEARRGNFSGALSAVKDMEKAAATAEGRLLTATATAQRKEAKEKAQAVIGLEPPTYSPTLQVHESGVPLAPMNPYTGVGVQKNMEAVLKSNLSEAQQTFERLRKEDEKNAKTEVSMQKAEAALKRMVIKAFELGKKEGKYPQDATLDANTMTVRGGNLPQVTGGVYGLPLIGEFFQRIKTSRDEDAATLETEAKNFQRQSYVPGEGQVSNFERELFARASLDLARPPLTNFDLIRGTREAARRSRDRSQFFENYYSVNRTLQGAEALWRLYSDANPIIEQDQFGNIKYRTGVPSYQAWFRSQQGQNISDMRPQQPVAQQPAQPSGGGLSPDEEARYQELLEKQRGAGGGAF